MGTVWRAYDELLDREVAIKEVLLPPGLTPEEREVLYKRTFREARASARLNHPGVVTVHDVVSEGDRPWIVMELVQARSLQEILDVGGPMSPYRAADIGRQVLAALSHAHKAGILHRDVKPSNVLICEDERAVLTDFGIAQMEGDSTLTQTGLVMGSPAYIPPERVQGERAVPASDLWALGATLYTCVEGRAPYERSDAMAALAAALSEEVPPPRNAGPLRQVLDGLLTRSPADRIKAADAMALLTKVATTRQRPEADTKPDSHTKPDVKESAAPVPAETVLDQPKQAEPKPEALETIKDPSTLRILSQMAQTGDITPTKPAQGQQGPPMGPEAQLPADWQQPRPAPQPYNPMAYTVPSYPAPPQRKPGHRSRTVLIVLLVAIVIAVSLVVGALILRYKAQAQSSGPGNPTGSSSPDQSYETQQGQGFTVAVPKGWTREAGDRGILYFYGPNRAVVLQVDPYSWSGSAISNARVNAAHGPAKFSGYAPVGQGVTEVSYKDQAADWEFTFNDTSSGVPDHAKDRFFIFHGHTFAVYFRTTQTGWNDAQPYLAHALDTFTVV